MHAAYCIAPGTMDLRDVDAPTARRDAAVPEAVIKVHNCGICGSDLHYFHGNFPAPPVCPGHEISGEVVDVSAPDGLRPGDRVAVEPLVVCGACAYCRVGDYQLCTKFRLLGTMLDGGFAEYLRVPTYTLFALPDAIDYEVGALTEPLAVVVHAVRLAHVRLGDRVLVLGAGTIGLLAIAAARAAGAGDVWITARHPHQAAAAAAIGATRVFATDAGELSDAARAQPVDVVIETVGGTADTLTEAVQLARPGGSVSVLGVFTMPPTLNALLLVVKEVRLIGSLTYGRCGTRADFDVALQLLAQQPEIFRRLITHRFALAEITRGFQTALDKRSGSIKVSICPAAA